MFTATGIVPTQSGSSTYTYRDTLSEDIEFLGYDVQLADFGGKVASGEHTYDFSVTLPPNLPASMKVRCRSSSNVLLATSTSPPSVLCVCFAPVALAPPHASRGVTRKPGLGSVSSVFVKTFQSTTCERVVLQTFAGTKWGRELRNRLRVQSTAAPPREARLRCQGKGAVEGVGQATGDPCHFAGSGGARSKGREEVLLLTERKVSRCSAVIFFVKVIVSVSRGFPGMALKPLQ